MYGSLVRRARGSRGLTQAQLAEISGLEQSNISAIENDRRMPTAATLHRLLAGCGYELVATAGTRVLACPPPRDEEWDEWFDAVDGDPPDEPATITRDTPMTTRARVINEVLDLAEAVARSR